MDNDPTTHRVLDSEFCESLEFKFGYETNLLGEFNSLQIGLTG